MRHSPVPHRLGRLVAGCAIALAVFLDCGCPKPKCSPSSCYGCCDSSGTCIAGGTVDQCGIGGSACIACPAGCTCSIGACFPCDVDGGVDAGADAGADGGGDGGPFARFCQSYASAWCAWLVGCNEWYSGSQSDCVTFYTQSLCVETWGRSVSKGYSTFDPSAGAACLSALEGSSSCDPTATVACNVAIRGISAPGQPCLSAQDCVDATNLCNGSPCAATCHATGGLGQPCVLGSSCYAPDWCDSTGVCRAPQPPGSPCDGFQAFECDDTSYCDPSQGACIALPRVGQACLAAPPFCSAGFYCDATGACQPDPTNGQSCSSAMPCASGTWCGSSQTCVPQAPDGGACSQTPACLEGLQCRSGLCLPPAGLGVACVSSDDCQTPLFCDPVLARCELTTVSVAGEPCTGYSALCVSQTVCKGAVPGQDGGPGAEGTCQLSAIGDRCRTGADCPTGTACSYPDSGSGPSTCEAASLGSTCFTNYNCPPGSYCPAGGFCVSQIPSGQACSPSVLGQCASPMVCRVAGADAGFVCAPVATVGAPCEGSGTCEAPLVCTSGQCGLAGESGQPCSSSVASCFNGACYFDGGAPGVCGPLFSNGQPCRTSVECASGNCESGVCQPACP